MTKPEFKSPEWTDIFRYLYAQKFFILIIPFSVAFLIAIFSLFLPNKYTSKASLLPSQRPSFGLDLFSEEGGLSGLASSVLGQSSKEESNRYIILLTSYTTSKKVIERFDLINYYELSEDKAALDNAINQLSESTSFESREEGNFVISVETKDPVLSKEIADYYVQILNELNTQIVSRDAKLYREYLGEQFKSAALKADSLKNELISFQSRYGIIEITEQVSAYFVVIGELTKNKIESELKLQLLSQTVLTNSEVYKNAETEYRIISNALDGVYSDSDPNNFLLNFRELPALTVNYYSLFLENEIQGEILKFLLPFYEQAKMEEAKSLPIVSIVDEPTVPILKSSPKRSIIVISAGISSLILVLIYYIMKFNFIQNRDYFLYLKN